MKVSISAVGFAIVLIVLALAPPSFAGDSNETCPQAEQAAEVDLPPTAQTVTVQLGSSAGCASTCANVRTALLERAGVLEADFSAAEQTATITIDGAKLSAEALLVHLEELGMPGSIAQG